jgi:hypothetical protein
MTKDLFLEWLKFNVASYLPLLSLSHIIHSPQLPKYTPYPGPLSVLVIDNAKIHYSNEVLELIDRFGELPFSLN